MDRLLAEIPAPLFDEWMAFYSLDPWGENRADFRIAQLTTRVYNYLRSAEEKPYSPVDFMPYVDKPPPPSPEELQERLLAKFGLGPDGNPLIPNGPPRPVVDGKVADPGEGQNQRDGERIAELDAKAVPEQIVEHGAS